MARTLFQFHHALIGQLGDRMRLLRRHATAALLSASLLGPTVALAEAIDLDLLYSGKIRDSAAGFKEPSGLALAGDGQSLWSVSDSDALLHQLALDGSVIRSLPLPQMDGADLEGVAVGPDGMIFLVQEKHRAILNINPEEPQGIERRALDRMAGYSKLLPLLAHNPGNKGLEGVTVLPDTGHLFVVIEGKPRLLLTISPTLNEIKAILPLTKEMGFTSPHTNDTDLDVSGLAWSAKSQTLWILSDKGRRIFVLGADSTRVMAIDLAYQQDGKRKTIRNAEGIALDEENGRLFVLTDDGRKSRLFAFRYEF